MAFIDFWNKIKQSPSFRPTRLYVKPEKTDKDPAFFGNIEAGKHYFSVRINEVFLSYSRKWAVTYDPMVFTVSEFDYDGKKATVPFVVGATLLKDKMEKLPEGMIFQDTRVAGLHPYNGGPLAFSIVLCRVEQTNYLRKLMEVIEGASSTYTADFATILTDYLKIAKVVMSGVESLLGLEETEPLVGFRREFDPDAGDDFRAGYYVLFNSDNDGIDENKLWVAGNRLLYGDSLAAAKEFRKEDYVLYSITGTADRSDTKSLPFYQHWKDVSSYATQLTNIDDKNWDIIRGKMFALQDALRLSPDLTPQQSASLFEGFKNEILEIKKSKNFLSGGKHGSDKKEAWEQAAMEVLHM